MWQQILIIYAIVDVFIRVAMTPVILRRRFTAQRALLWLMVVYLIPIPGTVLYFLLGRQYVGARRRKAYAEAQEQREEPEASKALRQKRHLPSVPDSQIPVLRLVEAMSGNEILGGNAVTYIAEVEDLADLLVNVIEQAEHHVHLLYYIMLDDHIGGRVLEAAVQAVERGVMVRVLIDDVGSGKLTEEKRLKKWRDRGLDVRPAMPVGRLRRRFARFDLRNHRKLAVIDGRVGFAGSHNLVSQDYHRADKPMGRTVDLSAEFAGPIVGQLQRAFLDDWAFETEETFDDPRYFPDLEDAGEITGHVVPTGPTDETETYRRVLIAALGSALERVVITTPYLIPDEPTLFALSLVAQRGVEVTLVVPERLNKPLVELASYAYYGRLIESGIRIYQHRDLLLHSKTVTIDQHLALVGSANLDVRSFELNFELTTMLYGDEPTRELRNIQQSYLDNSHPVELEAWRRSRSTLRFYGERAAALLSPLL